jgi:hypothetical protein
MHTLCELFIPILIYIYIYMIILTWFTSDMCSDTHPVILSSNSDIGDALSSSTTIVPPVILTPPLAPLIFYRNKSFPIIQPIHRMSFGRVFRLNPNGPIRMLFARKVVCFLSFTSRALTTQVLPPPSTTYYTIGRPVVCTSVLPLRCRGIARKRVVFHSLLSPSSPNPSLGSHRHQCYSHPLEYHNCHFPFTFPLAMN